MKRLCLLLLLALPSTALFGATAALPQTLDLANDRRAPYNLVGQLLFDSGAEAYVGSGSVVHPSSVLTAGHNVFDADAGWSTHVEFRLGNYGSATIASQYANHLYLLGGYEADADKYGPNDVRSFAADTAGLGFRAQVAAKGAFLPVAANAVFLTNYYLRVCLGYGAEGAHSGDYPLYVIPFRPYTDTYGPFFENTSLYFEGGMSGGPNFSYVGKTFYITGIIVSGATDPYAGGIRIVNRDTVAFIAAYLK